MENLIEKYSDTPVKVNEPTTESPANSKWHRWYEEKQLRAIRRLVKALRKHNRLLEQDIELWKAEEDARQRKAEEDAEKRKKTEDRKGFFSTLGKEIGKALPKIVAAVVTGFLGFFFKRRTPKGVLQAA